MTAGPVCVEDQSSRRPLEDRPVEELALELLLAAAQERQDTEGPAHQILHGKLHNNAV